MKWRVQDFAGYGRDVSNLLILKLTPNRCAGISSFDGSLDSTRVHKAGQ